MKTNPLQEKLLLFKIKHSKDPEAYGKLYDIYVERIYRFILFKVSRKEDAEDITSEVFLKTWQYIRKTDKRIENLNALLYRMARNSVIDYYRAKRRTDISISEEDQFKQIVSGRNVEKEIDQQFQRDEIEVHLNHLKDEYREVIILRYVEDFSVLEIAEVLQKSRNNVRVLIHRAVKRLKEIMAEKK